MNKKIYCKICGKPFNSLKSLINHIKHINTHNINSKLYYDKYLKKKKEGICYCGNYTKYKNSSIGYFKFCSKKCATNSIDTKNKIKKTTYKRYGVEYSAQSEIVKRKNKITLNKRYGVDHYCKSKHYIKKINEKFYNQLKNDKNRFSNVEFLTKSKYFYGFALKYKYDFKCKICKKIFKDHLNHLNIPRCPYCSPLLVSKGEKDIVNFCKQYCTNVIENDRKILNGKELDILIPDYNIAIEYNGLKWHSVICGKKNKYYHLNKTLSCKKQNIKLIHIFEDEWIKKQNIIKSIILSKLNKYEKILNNNECIVKKINDECAKQFLKINHLQGFINNAIHYGLYYYDELVFIASFIKYQKNAKHNFEIVRYCNKLNYLVKDGLNLILKEFIKKHDPITIIAKSDIRFGNASSYLKYNFDLSEISKPNYYYLKNYKKRLSNLKFRKYKLNKILKIFDPSLTEWENMKKNNYDKIWDCGYNIYVWQKNKINI